MTDSPAPDTAPETASDELWAHAGHEEDDGWEGPFPSREDAMRSALSMHDDQATFVIARARWVNGEDGLPDAEVIGDVIESYIEDNFPTTDNWNDKLRQAVTDNAAELEAVMQAWARIHLPRVYWYVVAGTFERITR